MRKPYDHIDWTGLKQLRENSFNRRTKGTIKQTEIASHAGMTQAYYSKIENGKIRSPEERFVRGIAAAFSTTVADLCENLPLRGSKKDELDKTKKGLEPYFNTPRVIPYYKTQCNVKGFGYDDGVLCDNTDFCVPTPRILNSPSAFAVDVPTDSMFPRYSMGDTVYVDPDISPFLGDDVVVRLFYENKTIILIRNYVDQDSVTVDEEDEPLPNYGLVRMKDWTDKLGPYDTYFMMEDDKVYEEGQRLIEWFPLFPEYIYPPKATKIDGEPNEGFPHAINVDVIVGCDRNKRFRPGSPYKRHYEVNPQGIGAFGGIPKDPSDLS